MRTLKNCAAILLSAIAALAVDVSRWATVPRSRRAPSSTNLAGSGVVLVTPLRPSDESGGSRAVKELWKLLVAHREVALVCLPDVTPTVSRARRWLGEFLLQGVPALRSSKQCLLARADLAPRVPGTHTVLVEFSEGALFLVFGRRLPNRTILRDHEVLTRRFDGPEARIDGWLERVRVASVRRLCRSILCNIYRKVEVIVVLSDDDKRRITDLLGAGAPELLTIPAAFSAPDATGAIGARESVGRPAGRDLLLLGNLHHPPNLEALSWFLRECAPHLDDGFTLHLCGLDAPLDSAELPRGGLRIVRHGFLDDIERRLGHVRIGVAPVVSGGGTRIKNLYLGATERVVVTTPLGNEGIGFVDGLDAIIRSDGRAMAAALNEIVLDPERRRRLGEHAARRVREQFAPESIWRLYASRVFRESEALDVSLRSRHP